VLAHNDFRKTVLKPCRKTQGAEIFFGPIFRFSEHSIWLLLLLLLFPFSLLAEPNPFLD